ncbi:MAG: hypothetical protein ACI308_07950 [Muribaculaceae bacterium]
MENIIGATYTESSETATMSSSVKPTNSVGDVYFVEVNDYWVGSLAEGTNIFGAINKGVNKIEKVDPNKMQQTSTGKFYPYQATNTNKFFFVERRDDYYSSHSTYPLNFSRWYNEWSYVDTSNGTPDYDDLEECYSKLTDGAPFFCPHKCDNSLEINHYITLNDPDAENPTKYSFTAYLYIPDTQDFNYTEKVIGTEEGYTSSTVYLFNSQGWNDNSRTKVSDAPDNVYILENGEYILFKESSYKNQYYSTNQSWNQSTEITIYTYGTVEIKEKVYNNVPYVFFYRILLGDIDAEGSIKSTLTAPETDSSEEDMTCYYKVNLDWGTSFDRFASQLEATSYDTMKEHFYIQRSFDMTNWETLDTKDVEGENVALDTDKIYTDANLPDFTETTKLIGYTVYYRIVSEVQKADGTVMSITNSNVITVNIPGTTPFKLTLQAGGTSDYVPGTMSGDIYTDGGNQFVNTLIAGKSIYEGVVKLAAGVKLELVRTTYAADGTATQTTLKTVTCTDTTTLDELVNEMGSKDDDMTTNAGEKYDAEYQLVLTYNDNSTTLSNIVAIVNSKVSNVSVAVHRSGTPDAATCAETELFRNEITFTPQVSAVPGAGYYIYCNGEKVLTLNDNTNNIDFTGDNGTKYTIAEDGTITVTHYTTHDPIAEGETGSATDDDFSGFYYAVVHFDPIVNGHSNTYGSAAKPAQYTGTKDELVVTFNDGAQKAALGKHYDYVFIRPTITWSLNKTTDDVKEPLRYDIYMMMEKAQFEVDGKTSSGKAGNVADWEKAFGKYSLRKSVDASTLSFSDEIYYAREQQGTGTWVNPISKDEIRPIYYYVKAVYSDKEDVKQNVAEKNSDVLTVAAGEGGTFTAIDEVWSDNVSVTANNGVITVTGAQGTITVYSATGQTVASAQADGGVTTIDASALNGVYIVKANNMQPTKILIK